MVLKHWLKGSCLFAGVGVSVLAVATALSERPLPDVLAPPGAAVDRVTVTDRSGHRLSAAYVDQWNLDEQRNLSSFPLLMREAAVEAEDRHFWQHHGVDWPARLAGAWQNLTAGYAVRGASTLTEQVVRMLHPRPRTVWSRWVEGFEAQRLERRFSKAQILEFWLNQVPYGNNRRGVVQAARDAFGRSLETLSPAETLALAVMPRAPSRLDPRRGDLKALRARVQWLGERMVAVGELPEVPDVSRLAGAQPTVADALDIPAGYYVRALRDEAQRRYPGLLPDQLRGSLDGDLQRQAQRLLDQRVLGMHALGVRDGALIVVDLASRTVRAWAVTHLNEGGQLDPTPGIDAVLTPRQPGSTMKPLVYALALEKGWTPATRILDAPTAEQVGHGLHAYRNYSGTHYGEVSVREALGNSLNIPAVKALQFVGPDVLLTHLRELGVHGLSAHPDYYGDGLALGDAEISLFDMATAYAAMADHGIARPLSLLADGQAAQGRPVFDRHAAALIANILSDPGARLLEFGDGGPLRFPDQVAVKTGTSSDYRDAWTLAWDARQLVGSWTGNLTAEPMDGVTGSIGPALLVRSTLAWMHQRQAPGPLPKDPELMHLALPDGQLEWFAPGTGPQTQARYEPPAAAAGPALRQPFAGLRMALDPRVPAALQQFEFAAQGCPQATAWQWFVDGRLAARTHEPSWPWTLQAGTHTAQAVCTTAGGEQRSAIVSFEVRGLPG